MIIKGLFRRYERWNPVHPTSGAFWGMGIGIGCGVGWGPGFGPEVIGYVGAGCGIGFSVGITLAGVGIGLPANFLINIPCNALIATRTYALEFARSSGILPMRNIAGDGWNLVAPHVSILQREASEQLSSLKYNHFLNQGVGLTEMKNRMACNARCIWEYLGTTRDRCLHPRKGSKD